MAEVELIINSISLTVYIISDTVETIGDSKSETPLSPSNSLTMKMITVMLPSGMTVSRCILKNKMSMCKTCCSRILEQMEKANSPVSSSKVDTKKEDSKLCSWWYCFAERCLASKSLANGKNSRYWCWSKKVGSATLQIPDNKSSSQVLRHLIRNSSAGRKPVRFLNSWKYNKIDKMKSYFAVRQMKWCDMNLWTYGIICFFVAWLNCTL